MQNFTVRIEDPKSKFSASHFLYNHNKCSRIHGHNYLVNLEVSGDLTEDYFVVDFYDLKKLLKTITNDLDHKILLPENSNNIQISENNGQIMVDMNGKHYEFPKSDVFFLPTEATTAELISKYIYEKIKENYPEHKISVEVAESESSIAKYSD